MSAPRIHPSAVIDPDAQLAPDVRVGPFAVIDAGVSLGSGCVVGPHAYLTGLLTAGANNTFHAGCVIGDTPQHHGYAGEPTHVRIGDGNTFRECVTVHRGMPASGGVTTIGSGNLFMVSSHVAHDCTIGNNTVLANGALVAGHVVVADGAFLSGNICVHQHVRIGRLAMLSGASAISQDLPPFWIVQGYNTAFGVNVIGMRRAGISNDHILAVRRAYKAINRDGISIRTALDQIEASEGHLPVIRELIDFVRASKRGIVTGSSGGDDA